MGGYAVSRSTTVIADPARVHGLINSFHEWPRGPRGRTSTPS